MIVAALQRMVEGQDLSREEARGVMEVLMSGEASDAQIAAFLTAMRMKGETPEELTGFVEVMREKVTGVPTQHAAVQGLSRPGQGLLVDTCGTGGDARGTFNISTAAAFVVAGAGIPVAKHGNRSVSGVCGSAGATGHLSCTEWTAWMRSPPWPRRRSPRSGAESCEPTLSGRRTSAFPEQRSRTSRGAIRPPMPGSSARSSRGPRARGGTSLS